MHLSALALLAVSLQTAPKLRTDSIPAADLHDATARVTFDLGGGQMDTVVVRALELEFSNSANVAVTPATGSASNGRNAAPTGTAHAKFVKDIGPLTSILAQHGTTGERIPSVVMDVADGSGRPLVRVRLGDVVVSTDRVLVAESDPGLEQQRLDLDDAIAQVTADLQEAQRQLNLTDVLDKRRLSSSQEVARARERVEVLQTRLEGQRRRLAMLDQRIRAQAPVHEEVLLSFARFELDVP